MAKKKNKKSKNKAMAQANGANNQGMLAGLLPSGRSEQFLLGAAIGAAAAFVLGDEALRGKLFKAGIRLFGEMAGNFEEMKEQIADLKAEVAAEQSGSL